MSFVETSSVLLCKTKNNEGDNTMAEEATIDKAISSQALGTENDDNCAQSRILEDSIAEVMRPTFCELDNGKEGINRQCDAINDEPSPGLYKRKKHEDRTSGKMMTQQKDVIDEAIGSIQEKLKVLRSQQRNSPANQERRRRFQERINIFSSFEAANEPNTLHQSRNRKT